MANHGHRCWQRKVCAKVIYPREHSAVIDYFLVTVHCRILCSSYIIWGTILHTKHLAYSDPGWIFVLIKISRCNSFEMFNLFMTFCRQKLKFIKKISLEQWTRFSGIFSSAQPSATKTIKLDKLTQNWKFLLDLWIWLQVKLTKKKLLPYLLASSCYMKDDGSKKKHNKIYEGVFACSF